MGCGVLRNLAACNSEQQQAVVSRGGIQVRAADKVLEFIPEEWSELLHQTALSACLSLCQ